MVNIKAAIDYVKKNGNEIERNRLNSMLLEIPPPMEILDILGDMQNPDGGFSYFSEGGSTIFDTVYVLTWIDDLQLKYEKIVEDAFKFLLSQQQDDGCWDEIDLGDNNSILTPGELDTQVFLTAYCAHWFVRYGLGKLENVMKSSLEFLEAHHTATGLILGDQQATWDSLVLFSHTPGRKSDLFNNTLEVIEKVLSPDECKGSKLAYLMCCLRDSGLDAYHPFVNFCTDGLIHKQHEDGSWESEYGEDYTVNATVDALRVLKYYKVI
jgi:hypothetical protein